MESLNGAKRERPVFTARGCATGRVVRAARPEPAVGTAAARAESFGGGGGGGLAAGGDARRRRCGAGARLVLLVPAVLLLAAVGAGAAGRAAEARRESRERARVANLLRGDAAAFLRTWEGRADARGEVRLSRAEVRQVLHMLADERRK